MASATKTTDHDAIRKWVEERGGCPARVDIKRHKQGGGILRIDFNDPGGEEDESLEHIGWDEFFKIFEENELAFLHQDKTADGQVSRFNKFVSRSGDED
ncbi:hypothetical protein CLG96_03615 [Sphingomonas oleivorans]|uniref:1,4-alpha-glucan branching enzyme n=2 Tax=Sphingomonas oleivorans TaxID=1735121 RepID=A0A2T5G392_9SPHN|nr:hypothetical protein CLG96_03615 [Sphingomonas oleivorans]